MSSWAAKLRLVYLPQKYPTPGVVLTPPPGVVFTPGEGVILAPPPGVKTTPTKERIYQNKVKQNKESHITESPGAVVCDDFQEILLENGIWPKQAAQLARSKKSRSQPACYEY